MTTYWCDDKRSLDQPKAFRATESTQKERTRTCPLPRFGRSLSAQRQWHVLSIRARGRVQRLQARWTTAEQEGILELDAKMGWARC